jgi:hypothetical protein
MMDSKELRMSELVLYEGPEIAEVPEQYREGVQRALARGVREQRLAASATSRLIPQEAPGEVVKHKQRGELVAAVLDDIFPQDGGSWGNLVDRLSGVSRSGPVICYEPIRAGAE